MAGCALICAIHFYRWPPKAASPRLPLAAILLIGVTGPITGLQFPFPGILAAFRRDGDALRAGEWWRMVTPLFVQADGLVQCFVNGIAALIFCPLIERLYGKKMLVLYFIPGLVGEIAGYLRHSHGAGSSVGICGVIGGLFAFVYFHRLENPRYLLVQAIAGVCGAAILCFLGDIHGPPILAGVLLAGILQPQTQSMAPHAKSDESKKQPLAPAQRG